VKVEVTTQNFFVPLRPTEIKADHGEVADDSIEDQQQQTPSKHHQQIASYYTKL
jgi:hypothetical protein